MKENVINKVFLGGTCNSSIWRDTFLKLVNNRVGCFNPVVEHWTEEAKQIEDVAKREARFKVYCLTPKQKGPYAIAELIDDSNKNSNTTLAIFLSTDEDQEWDQKTWKSYQALIQLVRSNGTQIFYSLEEAAEYLVYLNTTL